MTAQAFAILLASAFTFGCAAIFEMRNYARDVTGILFRGGLCLGPFVALVAIAHHEGVGHGKAAPPIAHHSLR